MTYYTTQLKTQDAQMNKEAFDPNLGPRARNRTAQARTKEEREWCSIDRLLNPDLYSLMKLERHGKLMNLIPLQELEEEPVVNKKGKIKKKKVGSSVFRHSPF